MEWRQTIWYTLCFAQVSSMIKRTLLILTACSITAHGAFTIQFDYSYDTGFFSGPNVGRRALLTAAANVFTSRLTTTTLLPVTPSGSDLWDVAFSNPATGATVNLSNPTIAANILTIYVGARDLPGITAGEAQGIGYSASGSAAWLSLFDSKDSVTHYEPLGGSITFDSTNDWYFDPDPRTVEPFSQSSDFFSCAQHEIAHLLGFNASVNAFAAHTSAAGLFIGSHALSVYGGPVPLSDDDSHLEADLQFEASFLTMDPALHYQTRTRFSNLEFAILQDIGYGTPLLPSTEEFGTLSVATGDSSRGTVAVAYRGSTTQVVGSKLLIQATPKPGYVFSSWTGDVASTANPLSVVMRDGLTIQANFIVSPFLNGVGSFYGVFTNGMNWQPNGTWRLSANEFGAFSGSLLLNGRKIALKGKFDLHGYYSATVKTGLPAPQNTAQISLREDLQTGALSGSLTTNNASLTFGGRKLPVYNKLTPTPLTGAYTIAFPAEVPALFPLPPQGSGYALMSVDLQGAARIAGKLADGTPLLFTVPLNDENQLTLSEPLLAGKASLSGTLAFPDAEVEGDLLWSRAGSIKNVPWNSGFITRLTTVGSRWIKPATGARVLSALEANAGGMDVTLGLIRATAIVSERNRVQETPVSQSTLSLLITPKTGLFTGSFRDNAGARRKFAGVFLQKQKRANGFYLDSSTLSFPVALTPIP
ncbi:MAG: hypothetical protein JWL59_3196 [Chthoniobacteraceae bacterium]|nr:hypothetical protein [Chthoniobacteraceae bacterium]